MTRRRKKRQRAAEQERFSIPRDSIPADFSKQAPNNSYDPLAYYMDYEFTCRDCGVQQVWTKEQQQWWYEVAKGSIYSGASRCRPCRAKIRAAKELQRLLMEAVARRRETDGK